MSNHNQDDMDFPGDDFQGDDFQDASFDDADTYDADYTTGDDLADDEWDAVDDGSGEDAQQAPAKKKSSLTNKLIIGAAVVVGAGVMVMTMMGGSPQQGQAPQPVAPSVAQSDSADMAAAPIAPAMTAPLPAPAPAPVAGLPAAPDYGVAVDSADAQTPRDPDQSSPAQGMFNDPAALDSTLQETAEQAPLSDTLPVEVQDAPAMPEAQMEAAPAPAVAMPKANDLLKPSGAADGADAVPAPVADAALAMPEPTPAPVSEPVAVVDAPLAAPVAEQAPSTESIDPDMGAQMLDRLDLIAARLDQLEDDLSVVRKESAATATDEVEELRAAVKALEKKLNTQAQAPAVSSSDTPPSRTTTLKAEPKPKPVARQAQSVQWVLKGAQPGRAMVARAGESEMRTVEVGDSLPGVGRISSIAYENGRWVVIGSEGRISQ
ncbi:alginate biosynthesis protein AlgP [Micavibrio aeruginosavorus]|uniref:alginate biosynthesis protein AlgP n=1 Tax=Micavibrio aeruginosavorus TaxID=349221 RepID=UPI003F4AB2C8